MSYFMRAYSALSIRRNSHKTEDLDLYVHCQSMQKQVVLEIVTIGFTLLGQNPFDAPDITTRASLRCIAPCMHNNECINLVSISE